MPPVAIARPLWAVALRSLRDLTRLAVTALVLAVGPGALSAASAAVPSADRVRPIVDTSGALSAASAAVPSADRVRPIVDTSDALSAAPGRFAPTVLTSRVNEPAATSHPIANRAADAPALRHTARPAAPAAPAAVTAAPTGPGADPAREAVGRRGPPRG